MEEKSSERDDRRRYVRRTDPQTSRDAANYVNLGPLQQMTVDVLWHAGREGLTTWEVGERCAHGRDSISPRMGKLCELGWVVLTGERRTPEGRSCSGQIYVHADFVQEESPAPTSGGHLLFPDADDRLIGDPEC